MRQFLHDRRLNPLNLLLFLFSSQHLQQRSCPWLVCLYEYAVTTAARGPPISVLIDKKTQVKPRGAGSRPVDFGARLSRFPAAADIKLASIWLWLRVAESARAVFGFSDCLEIDAGHAPSWGAVDEARQPDCWLVIEAEIGSRARRWPCSELVVPRPAAVFGTEPRSAGYRRLPGGGLALGALHEVAIRQSAYLTHPVSHEPGGK